MLSGPLKFKGCFALKYFSPRHHYILNLPNCSISNDFFCGSSTFSIYGSLVHKIYNFLWPQEFWEIPKGCLFFVKIPQITHAKWGLQRFLPRDCIQKFEWANEKSGTIPRRYMPASRVRNKCHVVKKDGNGIGVWNWVTAAGFWCKHCPIESNRILQVHILKIWKYTKPCDLAMWIEGFARVTFKPGGAVAGVELAGMG